MSSPLCKVELKQVIPSFLDAGERWSSTSWCAWLVMWAEKYVAVPKEGGRLWHLLAWEKQQSPSRALCSSRRCCQLNNTSLRGTKCCSARHGQPHLCLARRSADCSTLSPRTSCFSPGRDKVPPSAHSPYPLHSLLFSQASAVCPSLCLDSY